MLMFFVQFFLVLTAILLGIRRGGIALGPVSYTHLTLPTILLV